MKRNTWDFAAEPALHDLAILLISAARVMRESWIDDGGRILNITLEGGLTAVLDNLDCDVRHYLEGANTHTSCRPAKAARGRLTAYQRDWKVALRNISR